MIIVVTASIMVVVIHADDPIYAAHLSPLPAGLDRDAVFVHTRPWGDLMVDVFRLHRSIHAGGSTCACV